MVTSRRPASTPAGDGHDGNVLYVADTRILHPTLSICKHARWSASPYPGSKRAWPGAEARAQTAPSSPWDIALRNGTHGDAMGTHQLWQLDPAAGEAQRIVGKDAGNV